MTRKSIPPIDPHDLSDQADADRIERIWERLEPEIHAPERVLETQYRRSQRAPSRHLWLIAAAFAGTFGAGVWIGHSRSARDSVSERTAVPSAVIENAPTLFATGSMSQAFQLTNGGKLLLQPESTVEVGEATDSGMTLRLLHGSASIDATHAVGGPISIVAGEARLTAPAGGSVEVKRHERDMDVIVSGGTASIESPNGPLRLAVGQSALAIPITTTTALRDVVTPHRAEAFRPPTPEPQKESRADTPDPHPTSQPLEAPPPVAAVSTSWTTKVDLGNYDEAASLLEKQGGIEAAIRGTHNPRELLLLSDLARSKHRMDLFAMAARRLVDEFPTDQNSPMVAFDLSNYLRDDAKNNALAAKYSEIAQHSRLGEDALCEELKNGAMSPALVEAAKDYETRYPNGYCKDVAKQILAEPKTDEPKSEEPKKDDAKDAGKKDDAKDKDAKEPPKDGAKPEPAPSASAAAKAGPPPREAPKAPAAPKASASPKD